MQSASRATAGSLPPAAATTGDSSRTLPVRQAPLDASRDEAFDRLTRLTARLLRTSAAAVVLANLDGHTIKSQVGLSGLSGAGRPMLTAYSLGAWEIATGRVVAIGDVRLRRNAVPGPAVDELGMVAYLGAPLLTADGHVRGVLCVLDRRARRWSAAQSEVVVELAAAVSTLIDLRVLADLVQRLQKLEQLRNDFLVLTLHDLQQPVSVVVGQSQLLRQRLERGAPVDLDRILVGLHRIERSADDIRSQAAELRAVRDGEPPVLDVRAINLVALAREAVVGYSAVSDIHTFAFESAASEMVALADERRVRRVLTNLLSNAVKYSPDGGAITVSAWCESHGERLWGAVAVADQGLGIPEEDLAHVTERFFRSANVAGVIDGQGLGLASARATVEAHAGTVDIASVKGKGTTVTFRLPLAAPRRPTPRRNRRRRPRDGDA